MPDVGPFGFERSDQGQLRSRLTGIAGVAEIEAYLRAVIANGWFGLPNLIDARNGITHMHTADIHRLSALITRLRQEHGLARTALVTNNLVLFGMGRMYAAIAHDGDAGFAVFRDMDEAETWLGGPAQDRMAS